MGIELSGRIVIESHGAKFFFERPRGRHYPKLLQIWSEIPPELVGKEAADLPLDVTAKVVEAALSLANELLLGWEGVTSEGRPVALEDVPEGLKGLPVGVVADVVNKFLMEIGQTFRAPEGVGGS